ncbi:MAG: baseplate J/gp47 family protein [Alphaproteobacteria bacterium]|nr:baseplate J/gp47 family protein [Alphaproteobacteria bacterium]
MAIDLSKLPVPDVIDPTGYDDIVAALVDAMKAALATVTVSDGTLFDTTRLDLASEPLRMLIEASAYREYILRFRINDAVRGTFLASATGNDMDNIAALYGIERLPEEGDDALRIRTRDATETLTNAGTASSYRAHANSTVSGYAYPNPGNTTITATIGTVDHLVDPNETLSITITPHDTAVTSPSGGVVDVKVIGDWAPNAPFAATANAGLSTTIDTVIAADDVRQITDTVQVTLGTVRQYQLTATLTIGEGPTSEAVTTAADAAVRAFAFDTLAIGTAVPRNGAIAALWQEGVENLNLTISLEGGDNAFTLAAGDLIPDGAVDAFFLTDISITTTVI